MVYFVLPLSFIIFEDKPRRYPALAVKNIEVNFMFLASPKFYFARWK